MPFRSFWEDISPQRLDVWSWAVTSQRSFLRSPGLHEIRLLRIFVHRFPHSKSATARASLTAELIYSPEASSSKKVSFVFGSPISVSISAFANSFPSRFQVVLSTRDPRATIVQTYTFKQFYIAL